MGTPRADTETPQWALCVNRPAGRPAGSGCAPTETGTRGDVPPICPVRGLGEDNPAWKSDVSCGSEVGGAEQPTQPTPPPPPTHTHLGVPCLEGVQMKAHAWPGTGLAFSSGNFWTKFWGWRMEDEKFFQKDGRTKRGRKWGLSVPLIVPNQSGGQSGAEQRHLFHLNRIL